MKYRSIALIVASSGMLAWSLGLAPQNAPRPGTPAAAPSAPSATPSAPSATARTFTVDPVHSSNVFKISHMGVANFLGRFNAMEGRYTIDSTDPEQSAFEVTIDATSVDSNNQKRDDHLRSPDFFNTAEHPTITFKSSKVTKAGENKLRVMGDLTFLGQTRPVSVDMLVFPGKDTRQGHKSGFEANFSIKRSEFGNDTYIAQGSLGDEVNVTVCVEGATQ